jgi:hypothetical protein
MIAEALKYVIGLSKPTAEKINGRTYWSNGSPVTEPEYPTVELHTLEGLVDWLKTSPDVPEERIHVAVIDERKVVAYLPASGPFQQRSTIVESEWDAKGFAFNTFRPTEDFIIGLQTCFVQTEDLREIILLSSRISDVRELEQSDNGISQAVQVKAGLALKAVETFRQTYELMPYRTFPEANQPVSPFILRAKKGRDDGIECALFEADGGMWKQKAITLLRDHLRSLVGESDIITVVG